MKKNFKRVVAATVSASMLMGMGMTALAADGEVSVTAPIYSFEVLDVVVPTNYAVAFNPEGLEVKVGSSTSQDQILSKNYGMINKGNKDQIMTVTLKVEDQNTVEGKKAIFVNSAQEVTDAADGEYKIHLTVIPADTAEVQVGGTPAPADKDTVATDLDNVSMTGATTKAVTLKSGENKIGFKLNQATYAPKSGSEVTLGTSTSNSVAANYEISALATGGKGITAFTFGGEMSNKADWTELTSGIKITAVYSNAVAPSTTTVIDGTGAMVALEAAPSIAVTSINHSAATGSEIPVNLGLGDKAATGIAKYEYATEREGTYQAYPNPTWRFDAESSKIIIPKDVFGGAPVGGKRYLKVTFNDTAKTSVIVEITKTE